MSTYRKAGQGVGLQMGNSPSKADNAAMLMYMRSKTDSGYIRQAILYAGELYTQIIVNHIMKFVKTNREN